MLQVSSCRVSKLQAQSQKLKTDKAKADEKVEQLKQESKQLEQDVEQLKDQLEDALEAKEDIEEENMTLKATQIDMEKQIPALQERLDEQDGLLTMYRQHVGFGNA